MPDTKISALSDAGALTGTEIVPLANAGANERTTTQAIADLAGGGGAVDLISTQTADNTASSIEWTGIPARDYYKLCVQNLRPATDGITLSLQFGTGAGPTWDTVSTNYVWTGRNNNDTAETGVFGSFSSTGLFGYLGFYGNAVGGIGGAIEITGDGTNYWANVTLMGKSTDGKWYAWNGSIKWAASGTATAVRLIASSGNLNTGKGSLYGLTS